MFSFGWCTRYNMYRVAEDMSIHAFKAVLVDLCARQSYVPKVQTHRQDCEFIGKQLNGKVNWEILNRQNYTWNYYTDRKHSKKEITTLDRRRQRHYIHKRESRQRGNTAGHNLTDETGKQNRTSPTQDYHNKTGHTLRHRLYKQLHTHDTRIQTTEWIQRMKYWITGT